MRLMLSCSQIAPTPQLSYHSTECTASSFVLHMGPKPPAALCPGPSRALANSLHTSADLDLLGIGSTWLGLH